jgi:pimeloyl-ACP methyl ester carboxylesterase
MDYPVIALPGGVNPAVLRYAPLQSALGSEVSLHLKDLEVYSGDQPPPGYSIATEVDGLARFADSLNAPRFHLVAYSGGGFVSLAFAGTHPDRLASLAVFEPARTPGELSTEEAARDRHLRAVLSGKTGAEFMQAFTREQVRQGVELAPPSGPPPAWMGTRPAGLRAMLQAFADYRFDRNQLRACTFPALYAYGDQTDEMVELQAGVLARLMPDLHVLRLSGVHHFVQPEQIYTREHVAAIRELWRRAEERVAASV